MVVIIIASLGSSGNVERWNRVAIHVCVGERIERRLTRRISHEANIAASDEIDAAIIN